jgi:hypothetical protein
LLGQILPQGRKFFANNLRLSSLSIAGWRQPMIPSVKKQCPAEGLISQKKEQAGNMQICRSSGLPLSVLFRATTQEYYFSCTVKRFFCYYVLKIIYLGEIIWILMMQ